MEDSKRLDHHDEISEKKIKKDTLEIKNIEPELISSIKNESNYNQNSNINLKNKNSNLKDNKEVDDKLLDDNKKGELTSKLNENIDKNNNNLEGSDNELKKEQTPEDIKLSVTGLNLDSARNKLAENVDNKDKKIDNEKINFVLINKIGSAFLSNNLTLDKIKKILK